MTEKHIKYLDKEAMFEEISDDGYPLEHIGDVNMVLENITHDTANERQGKGYEFTVNPEFVRLICYSIHGVVNTENISKETRKNLELFLDAYTTPGKIKKNIDILFWSIKEELNKNC